MIIEGLSPAGTFVKLKMALLFSLVMGDNSVRSAVFLTLVYISLHQRVCHNDSGILCSMC